MGIMSLKFIIFLRQTNECNAEKGREKKKTFFVVIKMKVNVG